MQIMGLIPATIVACNMSGWCKLVKDRKSQGGHKEKYF